MKEDKQAPQSRYVICPVGFEVPFVEVEVVGFLVLVT